MFTNITAQKSLKIGVASLSLLLAALVFSPSDVFAGWTCCDLAAGSKQCGTASGNCDGCSATVETKNFAECGPTCSEAEVKAGTCRICGSGQVSNQCDSTGGSGFHCAVRPIPSVINISVGASKNFTSSLSTAPKALLDWWIYSVTYTSRNNAVATRGTSTTSTPPFGSRVIGVAKGSTTIKVVGNVDPSKSDPLPKVSCTNSLAVNVVDALACVPGASCTLVPSTKKGYVSKVTCTMPNIATPTEYSGYTKSFGVKCDVYNGTKLVKANVVNAPSFTTQSYSQDLSYKGTYKCSFQHCFENTTNKYCSDWGKAI